MGKTSKSFIIILSLTVIFLGIQYSGDFISNDASFFSFPDFKTEKVTDTLDASEEETVAAERRSNRASVGTLHEFNDAIVDIAEKTNPTVVTITTQQTVRQRMRSPFSFFFDDPRFDQEREFQREGLGSGVIVSGDGFIITNNHVIRDADEILVQFYEGERVEAEVVGADPASDVAILKVERNNLPSIPLGDSDDLRVGELVLAIGSPLSQQFAHTVSMGVVSAKGRGSLGLSEFENYIQTDAAINPGNSGGALINMDGELIGINTAIASRTGGHQGIGFAIPINMARMVMESIIEDGRVVRSHLGIRQGAMVDGVMARALNLDVNYGVVVGEVTSGGPAERAGLAEGDVILEIDGSPIREWGQFRATIANSAPGTEVNLLIFRDGDRRTISVTLEERPEDEAVAAVTDESREELEESLGFQVENLTDNVRRQLNLDETIEGVVVSNIQQGTRAYRQGLRRYDVITQVQNQPIPNSDEFFSIVSGLKSGGQDVMLLRVNRQGISVFIAVEL
jgi:serine protease Do